MNIKLLYGYIFTSFGGLYVFFFFLAVIRFVKTRDMDAARLSALTLSAALLATTPLIAFSSDDIIANLNLYVFSAFLNYISAYMYISLITKRFNYYAKVLNIAKLGILIIGLSIFTIFMMSINGYQAMFFYFTDIMPNNHFLNQSFAGARLTPLPQIISIIGTTLVLFVNILLLSRFLKDKLKGYQRLVILGVATSIFAKLNDFLISSGHGYYLVPASFLAYFFEILYFQFATIGNDD